MGLSTSQDAVHLLELIRVVVEQAPNDCVRLFVQAERLVQSKLVSVVASMLIFAFLMSPHERVLVRGAVLIALCMVLGRDIGERGLGQRRFGLRG